MRRRGFTLIEVVVVCAILSVLAALVYPNVVAMKAGRERDEAYRNVLRLAQLGREAAISNGQTYVMRLENDGNTVVLEPDAATTGTTSKIGTSSKNDEDTTPKKLPTGVILGNDGTDAGRASVKLPEGVSVGEVVLDGKSSSASEFALHFYADGQSEGGGFEMIELSTTRSLSVTPRGLATLAEGKLPDAKENHWEAGQYEQRTTGS